MTLKIKRQSFVIGLIADKRFQHANQFSAFFINRCRVKIINLDKAVRAHGMRKRASILAKLDRTEPDHIFDPLDRGAAQV